jgi:hypothetical protein
MDGNRAISLAHHGRAVNLILPRSDLVYNWWSNGMVSIFREVFNSSMNINFLESTRWLLGNAHRGNLTNQSARITMTKCLVTS